VSERNAEDNRVIAPRRNKLRELFRAQAKALHDGAIRSGGSIPADQLEALQRLHNLVEISEAAQPPPTRSHWPLIAVFTSTLLIASILLFTGPRSTEIEMDLEVSQMGFVLPDRQVLNQDLRLSTLEVSGLSGIQIPRARGSDAMTLVSGRDFESGVALMTAEEDQIRGQINLPGLILPAQTRVSLEKVDAAGQYRMSLQGRGFDLKADVDGPVQVRLTGKGDHQLSFLSPKPVIFEPQSQVDLDLTLLSLPQELPPIPLSIQDLSLLRIEDRRGPDGLPVRRVSTIASGTIYFEELNGQELKLRPGEVIQLEGSTGEIDSLALKDNNIAVQFQGRVRGFTAGPSDSRHSLMPTWLQWLKARQGLTLLWGTAIYLFGLVAGVLRWLREPQ
jgi:hypothetical protein